MSGGVEAVVAWLQRAVGLGKWIRFLLLAAACVQLVDTSLTNIDAVLAHHGQADTEIYFEDMMLIQSNSPRSPKRSWLKWGFQIKSTN